MKVKTIRFTDKKPVFPEKITVRLTIEEAAYIVGLTGKQKDADCEAIIDGGATMNHELYSALTGDVFNRYWHDGWNDYIRGKGPKG